MRGRTGWGTWVSFIPSLPCLRVCFPGPPESLDLGSAALLPEPQGDWLEGTAIVFGWNLLWDSPGAFQPLCRTVKVASHLPTDL